MTLSEVGYIFAAAVGPGISAVVPSEVAFESGSLGTMAILVYAALKLASSFQQHLKAEETHRASQLEAWKAQASHREAERDHWTRSTPAG